MFLTGLTFIAAVAISLTAAYFSIAGLAALFAAAFWPVVIMGAVLEVGKLVGATWLHLNWNNPGVGRLHKSYLVLAVSALMLITAVGIYGFLSKGHLEQQHPIASLELQTHRLEFEQKQLESQIAQYQSRLTQLDSVVKALVDSQRLRGNEGATKVRAGQADERREIQAGMASAYTRISEIQKELLTTRSKSADVEAKLGPIKYVAALLGWNDAEAAVRAVILIVMFAFDPLAVVLVISSAISMRDWSEKRAAAKAQIRSYERDVEIIQAFDQAVSEDLKVQEEKPAKKRRTPKPKVESTEPKKKRRSPRKRNPITGELEPRTPVTNEPETTLPIANTTETVAEYPAPNTSEEPERPRIRVKAVGKQNGSI